MSQRQRGSCVRPRGSLAKVSRRAAGEVTEGSWGASRQHSSSLTLQLTLPVGQTRLDVGIYQLRRCPEDDLGRTDGIVARLERTGAGVAPGIG